MDIMDAFGAVEREVGRDTLPAGEARVVTLRRTYAAPQEEVWDAITDPERIRRWFLPVTVDPQVGGKYQLEGNAGGEILACEPPRLLVVSWIFGADQPPGGSEVRVQLSPDGPDRTRFELRHVAVVPDEMWGTFGPGAVGVGWDLTLLGLDMHLRGEPDVDHEAFESSPEAREYTTRSAAGWGTAHEAAGVTAAEAAAAVAATTAFYIPPQDDGPAGEPAAGEPPAAGAAG